MKLLTSLFKKVAQAVRQLDELHKNKTGKPQTQRLRSRCHLIYDDACQM
jgi:hypothetical protein